MSTSLTISAKRDSYCTAIQQTLSGMKVSYVNVLNAVNADLGANTKLDTANSEASSKKSKITRETKTKPEAYQLNASAKARFVNTGSVTLPMRFDEWCILTGDCQTKYPTDTVVIPDMFSAWLSKFIYSDKPETVAK